MSKIQVTRDRSWAPCCFILCKVKDDGSINPRSEDAKDSMLVQLDYDFPGLAQAFGWQVPCTCGASDGSVDCEACGVTADDMISSARAYLYQCVEDGRQVEDPGYFDSGE